MLKLKNLFSPTSGFVPDRQNR